MNPGDLRRFKEDTVFPLAAAKTFPGRTFLVLGIIDRVPGKRSGRVELLIDGGIQKGWGYPWVEQNSEALSEAG